MIITAQAQALLDKTDICDAHLLKALLLTPGQTSEVLAGAGLLPELIPRVDKPERNLGADAQPGFAPEVQESLENTIKQSLELDSDPIRPEHLALGVLDKSGAVSQQLFGLDRSSLITAVQELCAQQENPA